jgi:hypothetical protein
MRVPLFERVHKRALENIKNEYIREYKMGLLDVKEVQSIKDLKE